MGIKDKIFGSKKGWNCDQQNPDGSRTCRRIMERGEQQVATGTEVTIGTDDKCNPVFSGDAQTFLDGDDEAIANVSNKVTSQCKKERGL